MCVYAELHQQRKKVINDIPAESCTIKLTACVKLKQTVWTSVLDTVTQASSPAITDNPCNMS